MGKRAGVDDGHPVPTLMELERRADTVDSGADDEKIVHHVEGPCSVTNGRQHSRGAFWRPEPGDIKGTLKPRPPTTPITLEPREASVEAASEPTIACKKASYRRGPKNGQEPSPEVPPSS